MQPKPAAVFWEDLCFNTQQAAEKAINAVYIAKGLKFPYTHDLGKLLTQLSRDARVTISAEIAAATELSDYALGARYPGFGEPVTEDEHAKAIKIACDVIAWAKTFCG